MSKTETATNSQKGIIVGVSMLTLGLIAMIVWYLFSGYGEITESGYQYARSLYTVCNQHDEGRLATIHSRIEEDYKEGKLSDRDYRYLTTLIDLAKSGDWNGAQEEIRQLLEAQLSPA